jgi:hypothetical protein
VSLAPRKGSDQLPACGIERRHFGAHAAVLMMLGVPFDQACIGTGPAGLELAGVAAGVGRPVVLVLGIGVPEVARRAASVTRLPGDRPALTRFGSTRQRAGVIAVKSSLDTSQHLGAPMATEFVIVGTWVGVANAEFFHVDVIWCRRPSPRSLVSGSDRRVSRTDGSSSGPRSRGEEQGLRAQPGDTSRRSGLTAVVAAPSRGLACRATGLPVTNHVSAGRIQGGWTRPCRLARYRRTCASRLLHGHRS